MVWCTPNEEILTFQKFLMCRDPAFKEPDSVKYVYEDYLDHIDEDVVVNRFIRQCTGGESSPDGEVGLTRKVENDLVDKTQTSIEEIVTFQNFLMCRDPTQNESDSVKYVYEDYLDHIDDKGVLKRIIRPCTKGGSSPGGEEELMHNDSVDKTPNEEIVTFKNFLMCRDPTLNESDTVKYVYEDYLDHIDNNGVVNRFIRPCTKGELLPDDDEGLRHDRNLAYKHTVVDDNRIVAIVRLANSLENDDEDQKQEPHSDHDDDSDLLYIENRDSSNDEDEEEEEEKKSVRWEDLMPESSAAVYGPPDEAIEAAARKKKPSFARRLIKKLTMRKWRKEI